MAQMEDILLNELQDGATATDSSSTTRADTGGDSSAQDKLGGVHKHELGARLLGSLKELAMREKELALANEALEVYAERYQTMAASQQLLYNDFVQARKEWAEQKIEMKQVVADAETKLEAFEMESAR